MLSIGKSRQQVSVPCYWWSNDLVILYVTLQELDRVIMACGNRRIYTYILSPTPRYTCWSAVATKRLAAPMWEVGARRPWTPAGRFSMTSPASISTSTPDPNRGNLSFAFTGDLDFLTGMDGCREEQYMDDQVKCWDGNPVHMATKSLTKNRHGTPESRTYSFTREKGLEKGLIRCSAAAQTTCRIRPGYKRFPHTPCFVQK